jgi:cytochrome P450
VRERAAADQLIYGLMAQRRTERDQGRTDLLEMLLDGQQSDGSPMTDREIRDNLMSMILAGHETTTGELAWAFQLLAHNQPEQDRLAEEIESGEDDEYLTATVNETLRRRPVFLFVIPREVMQPTEIGGVTYRSPAHLAGCTYLMHHQPELYPRPYEFRPERFIEETPAPRTWLPWGGGRKHCLGRHFAMQEIKAILRTVLAETRVMPVTAHVEVPRWRSAILVPGNGGRVCLRRRR